MSTIGTRIKEARDDLGMSQKDFARHVGVSPGAIGNYERDTRGTPRELVQIANKAGVTPEWLSTGRGPKRPATWTPAQHQPTGVDGRPVPLAQVVSQAQPMIDPTTLAWESILELTSKGQLPELFRLPVNDDAMGELFPRGSLAIFSTTEGAPRARDAVLVADKDDGVHFREFESGRGGRWRAVARVSGYRPLDSEEDGLRVLAICVGQWGRRG